MTESAWRELLPSFFLSVLSVCQVIKSVQTCSVLVTRNARDSRMVRMHVENGGETEVMCKVASKIMEEME